MTWLWIPPILVMTVVALVIFKRYSKRSLQQIAEDGWNSDKRSLIIKIVIGIIAFFLVVFWLIPAVGSWFDKSDESPNAIVPAATVAPSYVMEKKTVVLTEGMEYVDSIPPLGGLPAWRDTTETTMERKRVWATDVVVYKLKPGVERSGIYFCRYIGEVMPTDCAENAPPDEPTPNTSPPLPPENQTASRVTGGFFYNNPYR